MKIHCHTNLDKYKMEEWPKELPTLPRIGDRIEAKSRIHLRVVEIKFCFDGSVSIELHH